MMQWFRNNLVLVTGIVLPVLLVIAFLAVQQAPRMLGDPPGYDFLVAGIRYEPQQAANFRLSFEVRDERLVLRAAPVAGDNAPRR